MHIIIFYLPSIFIRIYNYSHFSDDKDEVGKRQHYLLKRIQLRSSRFLAQAIFNRSHRIYMSFMVHVGNYDEVCKYKEFPPRYSEVKGLQITEK